MDEAVISIAAELDVHIKAIDSSLTGSNDIARLSRQVHYVVQIKMQPGTMKYRFCSSRKSMMWRSIFAPLMKALHIYIILPKQ